MRIIAGEHRGRPLAAPKGLKTRPTTDRVRESLMSMVGSARGGFEGARVLDAFAGSGALGLEALSRGARQAVFWDAAPSALAAIKANVGALGYGADRAVVRKGDVLKQRMPGGAPVDLVFLDPPYALAADEVASWLETLAAAGALAPDAVVSYEHDAKNDGEVERAFEGSAFAVVRQRRFGEISLHLLRFAPA